VLFRSSPTRGLPIQQPPSSLAALLFNLNASSISSISATINGTARVAPHGSEEERYYRDVHLANNTFDEGDGSSRFASGGEEEARVVVVTIRDGRISDWKGGVRDWVLVDESGMDAPRVNGC